MGFKDLWIVSDKKPKKEESVQENNTSSTPLKFPVNNIAPVSVGTTNCEPHMDAVMSLYEKGFDGLNKPGVEFFEYFKSVVSVGVDNAQAYTMAFNMLRSLEGSMTKDSLLSQSKYYLDEIEKVHQGYLQNGLDKKRHIETQKNSETEQLKTDLNMLKQQLESVQTQISIKETALFGIDAKYNPEIETIGCKMSANDMAKDKILNTINKVVSGINTNL